MKCNSCGSEWQPSGSVTVNLKNCPFCGVQLSVEHRKTQLDSIEDVLSTIKSNYGADIFNNQNTMIGLFSDYAPKLKRERKLLTDAYAVGAVKLLIAAESDKRDIARKKAVLALVEEAYIQEPHARKLVDALAKALGWGMETQVTENEIDVKLQQPWCEQNNDTPKTDYKSLKKGVRNDTENTLLLAYRATGAEFFTMVTNMGRHVLGKSAALDDCLNLPLLSFGGDPYIRITELKAKLMNVYAPWVIENFDNIVNAKFMMKDSTTNSTILDPQITYKRVYDEIIIPFYSRVEQLAKDVAKAAGYKYRNIDVIEFLEKFK